MKKKTKIIVATGITISTIAALSYGLTMKDIGKINFNKKKEEN